MARAIIYHLTLFPILYCFTYTLLYLTALDLHLPKKALACKPCLQLYFLGNPNKDITQKEVTARDVLEGSQGHQGLCLLAKEGSQINRNLQCYRE